MRCWSGMRCLRGRLVGSGQAVPVVYFGWLVFASTLAATVAAEPGSRRSAEATSVSGSALGAPHQPEASGRRASKGMPNKANIHALIGRTARRQGVEPALVHAIVSAESAYNPQAVSRAGAIGLMQVMPATAVDYGVSNPSALFDPVVNVDTGVRHLKRLLRKYGNDYGRVIMAYNAGEGVVDRTGSNVTYAETLGYTESVIRRYRKLGGTQPTEAVLRKVTALRGKRGHAKQRQTRPSENEPGLLLPKVSRNLEIGNLLSSLEPLAPFDSPVVSAQPARATDRSVIRSGLRTGIDPAIRRAAPAPSPRAASGQPNRR
jgi:hypothetical protein